MEAALEQAGVQALILTRPASVLYATRFRHGGRAIAVVNAGAVERPLLVLPSADLDYILEDLAAGVRVVAHGAFFRFHVGGKLTEQEERVWELASAAREDTNAIALVAEELERAGLRRGRIATDALLLPGLASLLPELEISPSAALLQELRAVKSAEELRRLREAAKVAEEGIEATVQELREGITQHELAGIFGAAVAARGARLRMDNVSFGRSAAFGNANLPADTLAEGAIVRFDVGAVVEGYASDLSRCFAFGQVDEKCVRYYAALLAGQEAALDRIRPGIRASELFGVAIATVRVSGVPHYQRTNVGHGIGAFGDGYDAPLLAGDDHTPLEARMVLCVETPYYELGFGGLQVEDMVVVTEEGFEFLTRLPRSLQQVAR